MFKRIDHIELVTADPERAVRLAARRWSSSRIGIRRLRLAPKASASGTA
jgi:hypothetical protein